MRCAVLLLITLLSSGYPGAVAAQGGPSGGSRPAEAAPTGEIHGAVLSAETGRPVGGASIGVRAAADSTPLAGTVTHADGQFRVAGLRPGRYTVRVIARGFESVDRKVAIGAGSRQAELGELRLSPAAVVIDGITVAGERREVTLAPDRTSYAVKDMPTTQGGTAVDVLRNVPSVEVDAENQVSLRGDKNVAMQINGRTSPLRGEQMGNFLAQLPAAAVDRVEVVSNPSASQEPEGTAGIVNIVLDQKPRPGLSGGLSVGAGTTGRLTGSGNAGYRAGPLTLAGSYGYLRDERGTSGFSNTEYFTSTTFAEQEISGTSQPRSHNLTGNGTLEVGKQGSLTANLIVSQRGGDRSNLNVLRQLDGGRKLTGTSSNLEDLESDNLTFDSALSYKHAFRPRTSELTTELRFNREAQDQLDHFAREVLSTAGQGSSPAALENNATNQLHTQWSLQSDWTRTFKGRTRLETGYKGTLRRLGDGLAISRFSYDQNAYLPDVARSSQFDYDESVHAVYGVLSRNLHRLDLQAGLRLERAATQFRLTATAESFDHAIGSFFPSALVSFRADDTHQVKLSYSKRIERPNALMLNPVGFALDPLNVSRGNPGLKPEYTHAFELGYQQSFGRGSLQLTPFYRHTVDPVRGLRTAGEGGVWINSYENVATSDSYGTDVNGAARLGRVTGSAGVSAFQQVTDARNLSTDLSNRGFRYSARGNATLRIRRTLDAQGSLSYSAPWNNEQGRMAAFVMGDLALRQRLLGDRASLNLRVDPFHTTRFRSEIYDPLFFQETERRFASSGVSLTFSYTFGGQQATREQHPGDGAGG